MDLTKVQTAALLLYSIIITSVIVMSLIYVRKMHLMYNKIYESVMKALELSNNEDITNHVDSGISSVIDKDRMGQKVNDMNMAVVNSILNSSIKTIIPTNMEDTDVEED